MWEMHVFSKHACECMPLAQDSMADLRLAELVQQVLLLLALKQHLLLQPCIALLCC